MLFDITNIQITFYAINKYDITISKFSQNTFELIRRKIVFVEKKHIIYN